MARAARKMMADMRALERQAERMNIVDPREVTTEQLLGNGATPTMGLSQVRGGADCVLDAEDCGDVNGVFFEGECYNAPESACAGRPSKPGTKCAYPEWESRLTSNAYKAGERVMYDGLAYEAKRLTTNRPIDLPPMPNPYKVNLYWKEVDCDKWAGSGHIVGGLAERSGNTMMSGTYRGLGADSPSDMAMADVKSLRGGAGKSWFDNFVDGLIEKATKKVGELAEKAFNEYFDKLIEYGWNYAKEHGVNWIKENVFGDKVAKGVEQRLADEQAEVRRARNREAEEYRRRQHDDYDGPSGPSAPAPAKNSMAERKAANAAAKDRQAAAKKAYEEARDKKKRGGGDLEGGYGNYGAYAGGHCPSEEHLREEVSGKGNKRACEGGKKRRAPASASDGRRKRADIVKKVMAEKGLKMIEASKYVKAHNLY